MPRKSRAETKITIQKILDAVADQLIQQGYDRMSYTSLSKQTGISRTGISHHFPKKKHFMSALDERIYDMFIAHLELDARLTEFSESWLTSLASPEFISILRIMFHHIILTKDEDNSMKYGFEKFRTLLHCRFGDESERELEWLIGKSLATMSFNA